MTDDIIAPRTRARSLLKHAATWAGDDLEERLQEVYATRGKVDDLFECPLCHRPCESLFGRAQTCSICYIRAMSGREESA